MDIHSPDVLGTLILDGGKVLNLRAGTYLIGNASSKECDHHIKIDDPSIDVKHAAFVLTHDTIKLMDLFSQHGSYIDGKKIKQCEVVELVKSVKLQFGSFICQFRYNQESDSGFLGINDSATKDTSIIPSTPTNHNESLPTRANNKSRNPSSTPTILLSRRSSNTLQNGDSADESFFVKATQAQNNVNASSREMASLLEGDDEFFLPETQEIRTDQPVDDDNSSCDMFQLNTQDFRDGDNCSNDSDNLIANVSLQNSEIIPYIMPPKLESNSRIMPDQKEPTKSTSSNVNDVGSDTDCEEDLFNLRMDETNDGKVDQNDKRSAASTPDIDFCDNKLNDEEDTDSLQATQIFPLRKSCVNVGNSIENLTSHEDDDRGDNNKQDLSRIEPASVSTTATENLEQTQIFRLPVAPAPQDNHSFSLPSIDQYNRARNSAKKSTATPAINDDDVEPTQIFKPPDVQTKVNESIPSENTEFLEVTQKFIAPSTSANRLQMTPSPILLDSDEEENDTEFCLNPTLVIGEQPDVSESSKKNQTSDKKKRNLNKLFGSDDEDESITPEERNPSVADPLKLKTPARTNSPLIQPTPDFAFFKLPNLKKIDVADEIFRSKFKHVERSRTLLEESSDEDDENDPTKLMNRLLTETEKLDDNLKDMNDKKAESTTRGKRTVRKASSASTSNESDSKKSKTHSKYSKPTKKVEEESNSKTKEQGTKSSKSESSSKSSKSESFSKSSKSESASKSSKSESSSKPSKSESSSKSSKSESKESKTSVKDSRQTRQHKLETANIENVENVALPEKRATRQRHGKNSSNSSDGSRHDEFKSDKGSRSNDRNSKDRDHVGSKKTNSHRIETSEKNLPAKKLECDDRMTRKRHTTSKQETAVPKKRSKENDPVQLQPVTEEDDIPQVRKSNRTTKARIAFTKMDSKAYEKHIEKIGGIIVDDPLDSTVLITDKIYRTWKFLSAMGKGIPIVNIKWLHDTLDYKERKMPTHPNCEDYLLRDPNAEKRFKFSLRKSLEYARNSPVFKGYTFYCTPNTKPKPKELQTIIECAGGKVMRSLPKDFEEPKKFFIVSDKADISMWPDIRVRLGDRTILSTEAIIMAVMQQCVNFKAYLLSSKTH
ncbi:unnamed protein product [Hermetia illucens]|uniref:Mediator of DNA damage checkpoint protein 1 n=1 Tax=Hermetia illucens TaxID=343691 RepID=A0A7R8UHI1_HERIL|nr:mediator of DNA damage checkpoint protein 1 isoform X3 [Hermetia illucens]CAD7080800.1 unnamed protein product [Hermetia illucens]